MATHPTGSDPAQLDDLEFLSNAALGLVELQPEQDIFQFIADQLASLAPGALVAVSSYEPSQDSMIVRAWGGPADLTTMASEITQQVGQTFRIDEDSRRSMADGKLARLEGGLHELTFRRLPIELTQALQASFGFQSVYAQPFTRRGDFLGTAALLCRTPVLERARLVEAFTRLAAVAIQRRRAESRLRESEGRFRMLAENSQDFIFRLRLRPAPAFEYVSPASVRVIGYTPQELYAEPQLASHCLDPELWTAPVARSPSEPVVVECRHKDGRATWTEQLVTLIRDAQGAITAVEGVVRDITTRKEAEEALRQADRRKNEFLAVLSHELRNPLAPISNGVYILGQVDPASEQAGRARAVIDRQIAHLTRLIDDLLDVTRITRGKIRLRRERLDLRALVGATVEDHRAIFARARVALDVSLAEDELWIDGDRTRIAQVIGNLLQNAAKFTSAGGHASICVGADHARHQAVLTVKDSGAGVSPELLPHLFEPFMQADTTLDRSKGGLGLGLMLVKGLVEMHGGSVEAKSEGSGRGSEFTVRLPLLGEARASERPEEPRVSSRAAPRRVLVIEDNLDAASTLREALELGGHEVDVAHTGAEGIGKAHALEPDVVFCDIGLPDMDGHAVARALRADAKLKASSLVALTGYASPEDVDRSRAAGFDRHIAKPPRIEVLERILAETPSRLEQVKPAKT